MHQVYLLGYRDVRITDLIDEVARLDAVLVDIRFKAKSVNPVWREANLRKLFGARYVHLVALGNRNYKTGGQVDIVDYADGRDALWRLNRPAILMCVCADAAKCHRTLVGKLLRRDGFEVEELQLHGHTLDQQAADEDDEQVKQNRKMKQGGLL